MHGTRTHRAGQPAQGGRGDADDVPLRLHLATLLMRGGQRDEGIRQVGGYFL